MRGWKCAAAASGIAAALLCGEAMAQQTSQAPPQRPQNLVPPSGGSPPDVSQSDASATDEDAEATLSADDLDELMAPVALYPDSLLTQILYSATVPLDVVKAGRFVAENASVPDKDRAAAAEKTDWDPSVQALAAGFPEIVSRMNDHIDWTEQVGDAVLVQTDDVMDSVQRLRDQAADTGALTTNDAQTVTINNNDTITIAPTDPNKVYVPSYNPDTVYTQPAPTQPAYVATDDSTDFGDILATGAIVFGGAMILDEIFDDDDEWHGYWRGPPPVDWNDRDFRPRPNINVNGDVNIGNRRDDLIRRRTDRLGSVDRDRIDVNHDRKFEPSTVQRDAAKQKIQDRKAKGSGPAKLPSATAARHNAGKTPADRPHVSGANKPVVKKAQGSRPNASAAVGHQNAKLHRPSHPVQKADRKPPRHSSAFEMHGGSRAAAAGNRARSGGRGRR